MQLFTILTGSECILVIKTCSIQYEPMCIHTQIFALAHTGGLIHFFVNSYAFSGFSSHHPCWEAPAYNCLQRHLLGIWHFCPPWIPTVMCAYPPRYIHTELKIIKIKKNTTCYSNVIACHVTVSLCMYVWDLGRPHILSFAWDNLPHRKHWILTGYSLGWIHLGWEAFAFWGEREIVKNICPLKLLDMAGWDRIYQATNCALLKSNRVAFPHPCGY